MSADGSQAFDDGGLSPQVAARVYDRIGRLQDTQSPFERPALDRLIARGTVIGACGVALRGQSRQLAANAGVSAEEALKEWTANLIPGVTVIPSGTWGVNRAQEAGCTYCAGG